MKNQIDLNKIKIKDMFAAIRKDFDLNNPMHLLRLEMLEEREEYALEEATDEDVRSTEQLFIDRKLGIRYYPLQNRKVIDHGKVVPIEQIYGSENT